MHICFYEHFYGVLHRPTPGRCIYNADTLKFKFRPQRQQLRALSFTGWCVCFRSSWFSALKASSCTVIPDRPRILLLVYQPDGQALNQLRINLGLRRPPDPTSRPREAFCCCAFVLRVARLLPFTGWQVPNSWPLMPQAL